MLKLTKTGIGLLTKQYRSVLKKCLLLNLGLLINIAILATVVPNISHSDGVYEPFANSGGAGINIYYGSSYQPGVRIHDNIGGGFIGIGDNYTLDMTIITKDYFKLNNSSYATGIDFAANVTEGTTNASHLATTGAVNQLLNYYYTFRDDKTAEVIEFTEEDDSLSLMEVCHA